MCSNVLTLELFQMKRKGVFQMTDGITDCKTQCEVQPQKNNVQITLVFKICQILVMPTDLQVRTCVANLYSLLLVVYKTCLVKLLIKQNNCILFISHLPFQTTFLSQRQIMTTWLFIICVQRALTTIWILVNLVQILYLLCPRVLIPTLIMWRHICKQ